MLDLVRALPYDVSVFQSNVDRKISISLDAWTSSNNFAFMAIIAHFVTTEGVLGVFVSSLLGQFTKRYTEELLIDFRELEGAHLGANMAEAVWEMLKRYKIRGGQSN